MKYNPEKLLSSMQVEANNIENPYATRKACRTVAKYLESVILSGTPPKLRKIPFSWFYEAVCGGCGSTLQTDDKYCDHCGRKIDWKFIEGDRS